MKFNVADWFFVYTIFVILSCTSGLAQQTTLKKKYTIELGSGKKTFELIDDEISIRDKNGARVQKKIQAGYFRQETSKELAKSAPGSRVELVMKLEESGPKGASHVPEKFFVTNHVLVRLDPTGTAETVLAQAGLRVMPMKLHEAEFLMLEARDSVAALIAMEHLRTIPGVRSAEVQLAIKKQPKFTPDDPLFNQQWHLRNTTQLGGALWVDANITPVWERFKGAGVILGIIDDGLEHMHPDLAPNYNGNLDYDFNGNDEDPTPMNLASDSHGTSCAGVAAAKGNNGIGVSGAAPDATLTGFRLIAEANTDQQEADALLIHNDLIQIKSNSWGYSDGQGYGGGGPLAISALEHGTQTGRGGLGTIYVFAGGNGLHKGDNSNMDSYPASPHVIAVAAVNDQGFQSWYSEPGSNLLISAPSKGGGHNQGIRTTDLIGDNGRNGSNSYDLENRDYTRYFGGTSSACPLVSGVVALMLNANPNLGWRDVQEILIRTARRNHRADTDWFTNSAGLSFNHKYGAGLIDAEAAVNLALRWVNLPPMVTTEVVRSEINAQIPDNESNGTGFTLQVTTPNLRVEHVTLHLNVTHTAIGDLEISLVSPSGTVSRLAMPYDDGSNDLSWTFSSVHHWGEPAAGYWWVKVADRSADDTGAVVSATLKIMGSSKDGASIAGGAVRLLTETNLPANNAADPGEQISVGISLKNIGTTATSSGLTAKLLPIGGISDVSEAQNYGIISTAGESVERNFTFRVSGPCGMSIPALLEIQDGGTILGLANVQINLGTLQQGSGFNYPITITDNSRATPSPSIVSAPAIVGRLQRLTLNVNTFRHSYIDDVGMLLAGPDQLKLRVFCGGFKGLTTAVSYSFDDNATTFFPRYAAPSSTSYRCWDYYGAFDSATNSGRDFGGEPAVEQAYTLGEYLGLPIAGDWQLYVEDFSAGDNGTLGSWQLNFTTATCTDNIFFKQVVTEVREDCGAAQVFVSRSAGLEGSASVYYKTFDQDATAGDDYSATEGTLTFSPGEVVKAFSIPIVNDEMREGPEAIRVSISNAAGNSTLGSTTQGTVLIGKNDAMITTIALNRVHGSLGGNLVGGDSVEVSVMFTDAVTVNGAPTLDIQVGDRIRKAVYQRGSGGNTLVFRHVIGRSDLDTDGIAIPANSLALNSGGILDDTLAPAILNHAIVSADPNFRVLNPSSVLSVGLASSSGGQGVWHNSEDIMFIDVSFNQNISVVGSPQLSLQVGDNIRLASYISGHGSSTLRFRYLLGADDNDDDGVSIQADAINGGSILDADGTPVLLGNAAVASNPSFRADTKSPVLSRIGLFSIPPTGGAVLQAGSVIGARALYDEEVVTKGTVQLILDVGGLNRIANLVTTGAGNAIEFSYTVGVSDLDSDGISIISNALQGGSITDPAGNPATLINSVVASNPDFRVSNPATVHAIGIASSIGGQGFWHNAGDTLVVEVVFNKVITVSGSPWVVLEVGTDLRQAMYKNGGGSNTLRFSYTVGINDNDLDGISISSNAIIGGNIVDDFNALVVRNNSPVADDSRFCADNCAPVPKSLSLVSHSEAMGEWYHSDEVIRAKLVFDEAVTLSGGPQLLLDVGGVQRAALYLGGAGSTTLEFAYTVVAADNDLDGVAIRANALTGGTVIDQAGNNVLRSHPAIAANPAFKVAGVRPSERDPLVDNQFLRSAIKRVGEPMSFTLSVSSPSLPTAQIGLQWLFNNKPLAGAPLDARSPSLHLPAVKLSDAGVYHARFTRNSLLANAAGVATCNPTQLCVAEDFSPPRQLWAVANSRASISCNAAGSGLSYAWRRRDGQALPAGSSGINTKTLLLPAAGAAMEGVYECVVSHFSGSVVAASTQLRVHQSTEDPSPLTITSLPAGRVGAPYSYSLRAELTEEAKVSSFVLTGLPAGLKLDATSGLITGVPLKATANLLIKLGSRLGARSSPLRDCSLSIEPAHSDVDGVYHGWVARHPGLNDDCGSRLELTLTKTGVFSGKLLTGTTSTAFVGNMLDLPANALRRGQANIARSAPLPPCLLQFEIDPAAPNRLVGGPTSTLSSVNTSGDDQSNGQPISASISAWRGMSDPLRLPSHAGRYHVALQLPPSAVGNAAIPQGYGFAIITVAANGSIKLEGSSADGEKILGSTFLGAEGQVLLHQGLYTSPIKGSLLGELQLTKADSPAANRLTGQLSWSKQGLTALNPAGGSPATRTYRNGFGLPSASQGLLLEVIGGMYAPTLTQIPSRLLLPLGQTAPASDTILNATLRFSGGGIDRVIEGTRQARFSPDALVSMDSLNRVTLAAIQPATLHFAKTTLTATRSTGLFAGTFNLQDPDLTTASNLSETELTRSLRFSGLIVPFSPTEHIGYGFFMLPQVPMSSSDTHYKIAPVESGALLFDLIDG